MRAFEFVLLALLFALNRAGAQDLQSPYGRMLVSPGSKGHALLAALQFSSALNADSVDVAGCTVERAVGPADYRSVIEPALGRRIVLPALLPGKERDCSVSNLAQNGKVRLYIEEFVQLRRESNSILPYPERLTFEVRLQVLRGKGYREWHEVRVRPDRFTSASDGTHAVESWRVIRYEVVGWQWLHDHSSSSGPIR